MDALKQQDSQFIDQIRTDATKLLDVGDAAGDHQLAWNVCFGGVTRLLEASFAGNNEGLNKTQIEAALIVLQELITWLNTGTRRGDLQAIRIIT